MMLRIRFHLIPTANALTKADTNTSSNKNIQHEHGNTKTEPNVEDTVDHLNICRTAPPHSQTAERQSRPGLPGAILLVRIIMHALCPAPYPRVGGAMA